MRSPEIILKNLEEKTKNIEYKFERLYRNLYNPEFYLFAYQKIASSEGSMTAGIDGNTLDGMSMSRINKIIESLRDYSYKPNPVKRVYISKANSSKMRPLGIPSTDDKLIQEVVRMILEAIYEPTFSRHSHGFRPNRSCHTCVNEIKTTFNATKWIVEGDIKGCFDNIDHHVLINILRKKIKDENFLGLIWKFLKSGYMEKWEYNATYSGSPQGSGASPILANIYLNELDSFIEKLKERFNKEDSYRKVQKAYSQTNGNLAYWKKQLKVAESSGDEARIVIAKNKVIELYKKLRNTPCYEPLDTSFKKIQYARYADDFVIGVIGSKEDALCIKEQVREFLENQLNLILSDEKTKVTHSAELFRFLGFDLSVSRSKDSTRDKNGNLVRRWYGQVKIYVPKEKWVNKLMELKAMYIKKSSDGKEIWKPTYRGKCINMPDAQIVSQFNAEIRGLYIYYRIANNVSVLNYFYSIMRTSLYKTFACKYRTTYKHICNRYKHNEVFIVRYKTKGGMREIEFYNGGFRRNIESAPTFAEVLPQCRKVIKKTSLIHRLQGGICELCGAKSEDIRMHHIRKLKDLKGDTEWERKMIEIRRKSLAVCPKCFELINETKFIGRWRAGYAERCPSGSGGGKVKPSRVI